MNEIKDRYNNNKEQIINSYKSEYLQKIERASKTNKGKLHIIGLMLERLKLEHNKLWQVEPTICFAKVYEEIENYQLENGINDFFVALKNLSVNLSPQDESVQTIALSTDEAHSELKLFFDEEREAIVPKETKEESIGSPEFTTRRQVLAFYYLTNEFTDCTTDKTAIARFIQFLTSKETAIKEIKDTNIYKLVKQPFSKAGNKNATNKDLQYISNYFEKMGMLEIVRKIDNDIDKGNKK
jgi:hypothetical protein